MVTATNVALWGGSMRRVSAVLMAGFVLSTPAHAIQILGTGVNAEEVAVLAGILTQSSSTAVTIDSVLTKTGEAVVAAQETSNFLRQASEVVVDFQYLTTANPEEIYNEAAAGFGISFPELQAIADDVEVTRSNLVGERAGEPRTVFQLLTHSRQTALGSYHSLIAYDNMADGHMSSYMKEIEARKKLQELTNDVGLEALTTDYNANRAAIISARASALTARAARQSADTALEQTRIMQQEYVNDRRDRAAKEFAKDEAAKDLESIAPADETIDGLKLIREMRRDPTLEVVPTKEAGR